MSAILHQQDHTTNGASPYELMCAKYIKYIQPRTCMPVHTQEADFDNPNLEEQVYSSFLRLGSWEQQAYVTVSFWKF